MKREKMKKEKMGETNEEKKNEKKIILFNYIHLKERKFREKQKKNERKPKRK